MPRLSMTVAPPTSMAIKPSSTLRTCASLFSTATSRNISTSGETCIFGISVAKDGPLSTAVRWTGVQDLSYVEWQRRFFRLRGRYTAMRRGCGRSVLRRHVVPEPAASAPLTLRSLRIAPKQGLGHEPRVLEEEPVGRRQVESQVCRARPTFQGPLQQQRMGADLDETLEDSLARVRLGRAEVTRGHAQSVMVGVVQAAVQ